MNILSINKNNQPGVESRQEDTANVFDREVSISIENRPKSDSFETDAISEPTCLQIRQYEVPPVSLQILICRQTFFACGKLLNAHLGSLINVLNNKPVSQDLTTEDQTPEEISVGMRFWNTLSSTIASTSSAVVSYLPRNNNLGNQ
jgi:hypothetical protein